MTRETLPFVDRAAYRPAIDGRITLSSDDIDLAGAHVIWHTQSEQATESLRPATDEHQFVLYCSAEERGEYRYNGGDWRRYMKRRNDWFIAPAYENRIHWRWEHTGSPGTVCRIHIAPEMLDRAASSLFKTKVQGVTLKHRMNINDAMLTHIAFELRQELVRLARNDRSDRYCRSLIDTFLFRVVETHGKLRTDAADCTTVFSQSRRNRIQAHIENHLCARTSLDEMAESVWMSKYHFARVFKRSFGETPQAHVRRIRLDRARTLLKRTDSSIAHIASSLGFPTVSGFSRAFKQHIGLSPRDYRKLRARRERAVSP